MPVNVSIIVCCHNSTPRLRDTLRHLSQAAPVEGQAWEVVLVDNGSTDDTASQAKTLWTELGAPTALKVVAEPTLGLIHARKRGLEAAKYEIVSFVDDDNWVSPRWLEVIDRVFSERPDVGALGAHGAPAFEGAAPAWFARVQHCYACGPQASQTGPITSRSGSVYGAGATFRAEALAELSKRGFEHFLTGRQGETLLSGEDTELTLTLATLGWKVWYDHDLTFKHFMPSGRLTRPYALRLTRQLGVTGALLDAYDICFERRSALWRTLHRYYAVRLGINTIKYALVCGFQAVSPSPNGDFRCSFNRGRLEAVTTHRALFDAIVDRQSAFYREVRAAA